MRKLRSPNQNTRLWRGGRATGWKGWAAPQEEMASACGQPQPPGQVLLGAPVQVSTQLTARLADSPARIPQVGPSTINQMGLTSLGRNGGWKFPL